MLPAKPRTIILILPENIIHTGNEAERVKAMEITIQRLSGSGFEIKRTSDTGDELLLLRLFPPGIFYLIVLIYLLACIFVPHIEHEFLFSLLITGVQIFLLVTIFLLLYLMYVIWSFFYFIFGDTFSKVTPLRAIVYLFIPFYNFYWFVRYCLHTAFYMDVLLGKKPKNSRSEYQKIIPGLFYSLILSGLAIFVYYAALYRWSDDMAVLFSCVTIWLIQRISGKHLGVFWLGCNILFAVTGMIINEFTLGSIGYSVVVFLFYAFYMLKNLFVALLNPCFIQKALKISNNTD